MGDVLQTLRFPARNLNIITIITIITNDRHIGSTNRFPGELPEQLPMNDKRIAK